MQMTKKTGNESAEEEKIEMGGYEEFPDELWQEAEAGQPSQWMIMKEVSTMSLAVEFLK